MRMPNLALPVRCRDHPPRKVSSLRSKAPTEQYISVRHERRPADGAHAFARAQHYAAARRDLAVLELHHPVLRRRRRRRRHDQPRRRLQPTVAVAVASCAARLSRRPSLPQLRGERNGCGAIAAAPVPCSSAARRGRRRQPGCVQRVCRAAAAAVVRPLAHAEASAAIDAMAGRRRGRAAERRDDDAQMTPVPKPVICAHFPAPPLAATALLSGRSCCTAALHAQEEPMSLLACSQRPK